MAKQVRLKRTRLQSLVACGPILGLFVLVSLVGLRLIWVGEYEISTIVELHEIEVDQLRNQLDEEGEWWKRGKQEHT